MVKLFLSIFVFLGVRLGGECLCLEEGWARVLECSPAIALVDAEISARKADIRQAALWPNPIGVVLADSFGFCNQNAEDEPATTFTISQLIELGGKRSARTRVASTAAHVAFIDSLLARSDLRLEFTLAFIDVSVAQERFKLAQQKEWVAENILYAIRAKVEQGKLSPIQEKKAELALKSSQLAAREIYSELELAKKRLSSFWGAPCPDFECVLFELFACEVPPCCCSLTQDLYLTPDYAKAESAIFLASQNLKLQRANGIPNVTVTAGYCMCHDCHDNEWIVGIEMPLPIFDRNQGNIQRAYVEKRQAEYQLDDFVREFSKQIVMTHEQLLLAFEQSEILKAEVLGEACETVNMIQLGYENGKFEFLDLLEAQNEFFDIQETYLGILHDYHFSRAKLERLTKERI